MIQQIHPRILLPAWFVAAVGGLSASERTMTYTHDSSVLAPDQAELEVWNTWRQGRAYFHRRLDTRIELEYGLASRLQTALYLNWTSETTGRHTDDERQERNSDGQPELEHESAFEGISWEWKWRVADPSEHAVGAALYVEGSANAEEHELELKGIIDHAFADGSQVAVNLTWEAEWEQKPGSGQPEHQYEAATGYTRRAGPWAYGIEALVRGEIARSDTEGDEGWRHPWMTSYAGPVVHYAGERLWLTLTVMPQIHAWRTEHGPDASGLEANEQDRFEARLLAGTRF